jgi:hypothetical protein
MVLLFAGIAIKGGVPRGLGATTAGLLDNLALSFVLAGVGVMSLLLLLSSEYPATIAALIGSAVRTILVTAMVMKAKPAGQACRSRLLITASPITRVETRAFPGCMISAVRKPPSRTLATAVSIRSASSAMSNE